MSAQSNPVTFTQEEQVSLQQLRTNLELFNTLKVLLTQGMFPGNASVALIRCQQLADSLVSNTAQQVQDIEKAAETRSSEAKKDESAKDS